MVKIFDKILLSIQNGWGKSKGWTLQDWISFTLRWLRWTEILLPKVHILPWNSNKYKFSIVTACSVILLNFLLPLSRLCWIFMVEKWFCARFLKRRRMAKRTFNNLTLVWNILKQVWTKGKVKHGKIQHQLQFCKKCCPEGMKKVEGENKQSSWNWEMIEI